MLLLVTLSLAAHAAGAGAGTCTSPAAVSAATESLNSSLLAAGWHVEEGTLQFIPSCKPPKKPTILDPHPKVPYCWGSNPSSGPYGRLFFSSHLPLVTGKPLPAWQLRSNASAIVLVGCTPPPAKYFGIDTDLMFSKPVSTPFGSPAMQFASVGDALNHARLNTSATPGATRERSAASPFQSRYGLVVSSDLATANELAAKWLPAAGVPTAETNQQHVPMPSLLPPQPGGMDSHGWGLGHSVFATYMRIAVCDDAQACEAYRNLTWRVLMVTPPSPHTVDPAPLVPYRNRTVGEPEGPKWGPSLDRLQAAISKAEGETRVLAQSATLLPINNSGLECMRDGLNCLGFTHDAAYMDGNEPFYAAGRAAADDDELSAVLAGALGGAARAPLHGRRSGAAPRVTPPSPSFSLAAGDLVVAFGVIHTRTGHATYTNAAIYDSVGARGIAAIADDKLDGSAAAYGIDAPELYAYAFARDCAGRKFCVEVPTEWPGCDAKCNLTLSERAYLHPKTLVGPDPLELSPPRFLRFTAKKACR